MMGKLSDKQKLMFEVEFTTLELIRISQLLAFPGNFGASGPEFITKFLDQVASSGPKVSLSIYQVSKLLTLIEIAINQNEIQDSIDINKELDWAKLNAEKMKYLTDQWRNIPTGVIPKWPPISPATSEPTKVDDYYKDYI